MKRLLWKVALSVVLLVVAAAGLLTWWVQRADLGAMVRSQATRVEAATGRKLTVHGPVGVRLFPRLRVVVEDIRLANAPWGSSSEMVSIKRIEGDIGWSGLWRGQIEIGKLDLKGLELLLETDAHGRGNWQIDGPSGSAPSVAEGSREPRLVLEAGHVEQGRVLWRDGRTGQAHTLGIDRLDIALQRSGGDRLDLEGKFNGTGFTVKGTMPRLASIGSGGAGLPIDLAFATDGASATARGTLTLPHTAFDLNVTAALHRPDALLPFAGVKIDVPLPVSLTVHARGTPARVVLDPLTLVSGKHQLTGKASYASEGKRPHIGLDLHAPILDMADFGPAPQPRAAKAGQPVFPDTPLPFDLIRQHEVDAVVAIDLLRLRSGLELADLKVEAGAHRGILDVKSARLQLADGEWHATANIDASHTRPLVRVEASGRQVSMEKLTADGKRARLTGGRTDFTLRFAGSGNSLRALATTANGELILSVGKARVAAGGLDFGGDLLTRLSSAVNPFHATDRFTELQCMAVRLPAKDGVITVRRTIAYQTSKVNVVAAGTIDLRSESLDLAIRPTINEGIGIGPGQLAEIVRLTGPINAPGIRLDTLGALRAAASVGGAVATGGLSLLGEAILRRGASDPAPCRTALAGGPAEGERGRGERGTTVEGAVEGAVGAGVGAVRRLFGTAR
ncbi:MAG: AsmA family protein [Burkholderiales bacterium]